MRVYLVLLLMMMVGSISGQGNVRFVEDSNVADMMRRWVQNNRSSDKIKGWRVQIITTDDRRKMETAMSKFHELYPDEKVSWEHVPPYYKVKVGAFEKKLHLMNFLNQLKEDFPSVIPIPDNIDKTDFIRI